MGEMNGIRLLKGSVTDVQFYGHLLAYALKGEASKDDYTEDVAFRTIAYTIPIMGNPHNPKSITLWLRLDRRGDNESEIRIEHGAEFIEWQMITRSLCNCCAFNKSATGYFCLEWHTPNDSKQSCASYKFSEKKLKEYFERVKNRQ